MDESLRHTFGATLYNCHESAHGVRVGLQ